MPVVAAVFNIGAPALAREETSLAVIHGKDGLTRLFTPAFYKGI